MEAVQVRSALKGRTRNIYQGGMGEMAKSCKGLATELVKCLSECDCIKVEKRSFRECAGEKSPSISSKCIGLRETYFNCKRGQVLNSKYIDELWCHSRGDHVSYDI
ncbi:hypothetical protein DVH24_020273 [Malus domestica]|uniref:Cytochrome c oxidase assembly factor 5 n=1 Tax=Malus domestica TaxID=3750 RepID=A0A498J6V4_MALDO|nr:hypothetical protein DVH24_020273 [Malus domestica]